MESVPGDRDPHDRARGLHDTQETVAVAAVPSPAAQAGPGRRRLSLRVVAGVLAGVLAAGAGVGTWLATRGGAPPTAPGTLVTSRTVRVTRGTMAQTASASGTIQPAQTADLNFPVPGQVTAVDVAVGDMVKTGQVLATLAPTALDAQEAAAQSALDAAQAKLAADEAQHASTAVVASDESAVASAQTHLTTAKKSVAGTTLVSSMTGEVATVDLTVGEQVSGSGGSGSSTSPSTLYGPPGAGTPNAGGPNTTNQVTIVSPDRFVVHCSVDDTEVAQLADGDRVIVHQTGTPVSAPGKITFLGLVPNGTGIPSYPLTVTLTGTPSGIYSGTTARMTIVVKRLTDVLEVPTPAVTYRGSRASVEVVLPGGGHATRAVTVGTTSNGETQITGGLQAGDRVVEHLEAFRSAPPTAPTARTTKRPPQAPGARFGVTRPTGAPQATVATGSGVRVLHGSVPGG